MKTFCPKKSIFSCIISYPNNITAARLVKKKVPRWCIVNTESKHTCIVTWGRSRDSSHVDYQRRVFFGFFVTIWTHHDIFGGTSTRTRVDELKSNSDFFGLTVAVLTWLLSSWEIDTIEVMIRRWKGQPALFKLRSVSPVSWKAIWLPISILKFPFIQRRFGLIQDSFCGMIVIQNRSVFFVVGA